MSEKKKRGLAVVDPERRREIARMGGRAIAPENRAFSQNRDLASRAGRLGGSRRKKNEPQEETT